jgi:hypothetical protein
MPESAARTYISQATEALSRDGINIRATDKVLIYAALAQAEATLEIASLLKNGITLRQAGDLSRALDHIATKLSSR